MKSTDDLIKLKRMLEDAVRRECSRGWCLRIWSRFVRARDAYRCVNCASQSKMAAHHIIRRATYPDGYLELGNGITLCDVCHGQVHKLSNRQPVPGEPLNARGGDDQDDISFLYGILMDDADRRGLSHDDFYYIRDEMLEFFISYQGYEDFRHSVQSGSMSRLRLAHEIWRGMPESWYSNLAGQLGEHLLRHRSQPAATRKK